MRKTLSLAAALIAALAIAAPVGAITNGAPDGGEHPYVGELLFYVPDAPSSRFADPGSWFTCSGTLLSPTVMVTAGHCTFGVGKNSVSTTHDGADTDAAHGGVGGNDVWVSFAEVPNFDILPPSSTFTSQAARYAGWTAALNSSSEWHRGTATPHPQRSSLAHPHASSRTCPRPASPRWFAEVGRVPLRPASLDGLHDLLEPSLGQRVRRHDQ